MWGFTVDDALISIRYARHLREGAGWVFNPGGPSTDGVTPLPWPLLLAPIAGADAFAALGTVKALGVVAAAATGAIVGDALSRGTSPVPLRVAILAAMACVLPAAAYASSGMETPFAMLLVALAAARLDAGHARTATVIGGLAVTLRPELAPWAAVVGFGAPPPHADPARSIARRVGFAAIALSPFAACTVLRLAVWGSPVPLALRAKPSDLSHGFVYAGAVLLVSVAPVLLLAPGAWARAAPSARALMLAGCTHILAMIAVGGDWMPYGRLVVPVLPALFIAAGRVAEISRARWSWIRLVVACALGAASLVRAGPQGRHVTQDRRELGERLRRASLGAQRIATLDIGWVGAALPGAEIVDLAGVTDPEIAALPGGHTSKRVDATMLLARRVDHVLFYRPAEASAFGRAVEVRLAASDLFRARYREGGFIPLGDGAAGYVVFEIAPP